MIMAKEDHKRKREIEDQSEDAKKRKVSESPGQSSEVGLLFVCGSNIVGQLGLGECIEMQPSPVQVNFPEELIDIAAGGMHTVCLTKKGEIFSCGCNDEAALGRNTETESLECVLMKADIPDRVIQVSAGDCHSAVLTENGEVYLFGAFRNQNGLMGSTPPDCHPRMIKIPHGEVVVKIASGANHLVCLTEEGRLYTCGCGENGQLGRVPRGYIEFECPECLLNLGLVRVQFHGEEMAFDDIWTGSYCTFAKTKTLGLIYGFGLNNFGQLGLETSNGSIFAPTRIPSLFLDQWVEISGGDYHTLAMNKSGQVYSFGRKEYGRLGLGEDCEDQRSPAPVRALQRRCINISCGDHVSFAVTDEGEVYSWGMGTNYQLGHGDDSDVHVPQRIGQLNEYKAFRVSGGGLHTLILANKKGANGKLKNNISM